MVAAESRFEMPETDEIFLVSQRKYNLDEDRPWWEKAFFVFVWLPVVRFGFNHMHIAAPSAMKPDGTIVLVEQAGAYSDRPAANARCENEFFSVKRLPFDADLPNQSVQYSEHDAPKSMIPFRYRRRRFAAAVPMAEQRKIEKGIAEAIEHVDRLWKKARAPVQ